MADQTSALRRGWSGLLAVANVLVSQLNTALVTAGSFLITPAILLSLGDSAYGGWLLMNSLVGYMRLLDSGTSSGTMKYGAEALARDDAEETAKVFNTSAAVFSSTGVAAMLFGCLLGIVLPRFYSTVLDGQGGPIVLLAASLAVDLFFRVYAAALRTRSLYVVCDSIEIVTYSIFKLGLILYYSHSLSYRVLAYITLAEAVARNVLVIAASLYLCPFTRRVNPFRASAPMFRHLATMTAAIVVIQIADLVRFQLDTVVLAAFRPNDPVAISIFGVGTRLPTIANFAIGVIGSVMLPRFAGLAATGEHEGLLSLLRKTSTATGLACIYLLTNCAVLGPHFLLLWLKKPWVVQSGHLLMMMMPAYFISLLGAPASTLLVSRGRLRGQTVITVIEALFNLGLSIALVGRYGIYGVAIGTIIPMLIVRGVLFPIVLQRDLGIRQREYWRIHARTIVLAVVYLILIGGVAFIPMLSYTRFLLLGLATTVVFVLLLVAGVPEARSFIGRRLGLSTTPA